MIEEEDEAEARINEVDEDEDEDFGLGTGIKARKSASELGVEDEDDFIIDDDLVASDSDVEASDDDVSSDAGEDTAGGEDTEFLMDCSQKKKAKGLNFSPERMVLFRRWSFQRKTVSMETWPTPFPVHSHTLKCSRSPKM